MTGTEALARCPAASSWDRWAEGTRRHFRSIACCSCDAGCSCLSPPRWTRLGGAVVAKTREWWSERTTIALRCGFVPLSPYPVRSSEQSDPKPNGKQIQSLLDSYPQDGSCREPASREDSHSPRHCTRNERREMTRQNLKLHSQLGCGSE